MHSVLKDFYLYLFSLSHVMQQLTEVHCLPLVFKNKAKHEDCIDILSEYAEESSAIYREAHGEELSKSLLAQY